MLSDLSKTDPETCEALTRLVPTYVDLVTTSKIHLIQSIVSRLIVNEVFAPYFVGLPAEESADLERIERRLAAYGKLPDIRLCRAITYSKQVHQRAQINGDPRPLPS